MQNIIICIFSIIFYAWGEIGFIFVLLLSTIFNYHIGLIVNKDGEKNKTACIVGVVFNILLLFIFRYLNFFADFLNVCHILPFKTSVYLPIGISIYSLKSISYLIDVYRDDVSSQKKFSNLLLYLFIFPQITVGPIVKYKNIEENIYYRAINTKFIYDGIQRIIIGIGKKVILANQLGIIVDSLIKWNILDTSIMGRIFGVALFGLELYFDFSGYTDISIGICKIIGFNYEENFNFPFFATSITEFWKRWNMSLGNYIRDYIYIPLGGNKKNQFRNIIIVWMLVGMWHSSGAMVVLCGIFLCGIIVFEKYILNIEKNNWPMVSKIIYTMIILMVLFAMFYYERISDFGKFINVWNNGFKIVDLKFFECILKNIYIIIISMICAMPYIPRFFESIKKDAEKKNGWYIAYNVVYWLLLLSILVISTVILVGENNTPFIYTRF